MIPAPTPPPVRDPDPRSHTRDRRSAGRLPCGGACRPCGQELASSAAAGGELGLPQCAALLLSVLCHISCFDMHLRRCAHRSHRCTSSSPRLTARDTRHLAWLHQILV